eukprot:TRINITY_DN20157_c0_g1_i1.p2 TRINITY_DN20157_c0_g1~~TRINITY_DN20157_c0_g1_i1.p2  ORF type:complete len:247 (+),score=49.81 TRINITY_DN20157_c0_g1_i1:286-1026(+)
MAQDLLLPDFMESEEDRIRDPDGQPKEKVSKSTGASKGGGKKRYTKSLFLKSKVRRGDPGVGSCCPRGKKKDSRETRSMVEWTVLIPGCWAFVEAALEEGRAYALETQRRKGVDLGSSHIRICIKALQDMARTPELLGQAPLMKALKDLWEGVFLKRSKEEIAHYVLVFMMSKPKKPTKEILEGGYAKMTFKFVQTHLLFEDAHLAGTFQDCLIRGLKALGFEVKAGAPPRSANERKLRDMVRRMS